MKKNRKVLINSIGVLLLTVTGLTRSFAQGLILNFKDESLPAVLKQIEKLSKVRIQYVYSDVSQFKVTKNLKADNALDAVKYVISGLPLSISERGNGKYLVLNKVSGQQSGSSSGSSSQEKNRSQERNLKGRVLDSEGKPVINANVYIQQSKTSLTVDSRGNFELKQVPENFELVISSVGFKPLSATIRGNQVIDSSNYAETTANSEEKSTVILDQSGLLQIKLAKAVNQLESVVVTGIFTRSKESFTGSATTYTQKELRQVGGTNILQSLKTLDPAFAMRENVQLGSDPNRLPNLEIRGKSSIIGERDGLAMDPNQPLFILDGFESTLAAINDIDINRIESITILKDAASTAIYGSKAANGVVVVETVKPKAGKLQVSYTGNMNISAPDLSSYNLMNSREKLQFELLAGRYDPLRVASTNFTGTDLELTQLYNQRYRAIEEGVDTYWLSEPTRLGINQKHSLYVMGGEGNFLFGLGGGLNGISGVMKNSDRKILNGNIDIIYRVSKFQFSNKFTVSNTNSSNPIVGFQDYANANPYYRKYNADGSINQWLENTTEVQMANPLWNASLNSRDKGKNLVFSNFFVTEWTPSNEWRVRGRFGMTYDAQNNERFISPDDTRQILGKPATRRGEFTSTNMRSNQYEGDATVTYAKILGEHRINFVVGGNINSKSNLQEGYVAEGFPSGDFTYPTFARGYFENGTPTYIETISRSLNGYLNGGYSFNDVYLLDVNLRSSGSSIFGSKRAFSNTWSLGLGWNVHREKFIMNKMPWIDFFKIRGSIGNPGNQNFESGRTLLTYAFPNGIQNYFGLGAFPNQVGNPNLKWQVTQDKNIGLDLTIFDKKFGLTVDYFHKVTNPLLITIDMPLSSGVPQYFTNAGNQISKGVNFSANYQILRDVERRILWSVRLNGRTQKIIIDDIGDKMQAFNKAGRGISTTRYFDGSDPDDIWGVRSFGIDPSTGKELFMTSSGNFTYDFSYDDEVLLGNKRPKVEGILGSSFTYKGFTFSANLRYQFGADVFNDALRNKVENVNLNYNQDKRALYERWIRPGDVTSFKNIIDINESPMSSRFIQRENTLMLESLYAEYQFVDGWIKKFGLGNFRVFASVRDLARISSIRAERGTDYPFARVIDGGLSFNF